MKNQEQGGLPSTGETKGKTLHTPSPAPVKASGNLAEELSQRTLKRLQSGAAWPEGCHNQCKDTSDPGSEAEGCVYSRKRHFPCKTGTSACCRLGSSALDKPSAETCCAESVEQQKTTGGGKNLPFTQCRARNTLRVVGLCWRTWGLNIHLICFPLYQPKAGEITTLTEWFYTSAKEQMGPTNIPHVADTGTATLSLSSQSCLPPPQLQSNTRANATTLLIHLLTPLLIVTLW